MKNIVLTSCGIINEKFKEQFYGVINKEEAKNKKILYITTASDGENDSDKSWMADEYKTILDLGFSKENIHEYKIGQKEININDFDVIYMMGGNTFYLMDMIRKHNFDKVIKKAIDKGTIYIGSSAGSIILGNSVEYALPFDENNVDLKDFSGLRIIDGIIIPHANRKEEFIRKVKENIDEELYLLYDENGIIIQK
jgi:dipeptidase E